MNSDNLAIKVSNISKYYRIGLKEEMQGSFAGSVASFMKSPLKNFKKHRSLYQFDDANDEGSTSSNGQAAGLFMALQNISFEVGRGEVLGVIGKNGAGKSTLLKILSRITFPTKGHIEIHGRSSSLLEVGTGFHPELTGRENVYLNGTVLGMKKTEIDRKFDEIVDFSGVEKFLDTPVKRYSSGMNVRLAFAVAAHLEPEILIIDEVLAVGDAEFQAKCLGKMSNVAKEGRTVLFVSHNMGAITQLCTRALWIEGGTVKDDGLPVDVVTNYLSAGAKGVGSWVKPSEEGDDERMALFTGARIVSARGDDDFPFFHFGERAKVEINYEIKNDVRECSIYLFLRDSMGNLLWFSHDNDESFEVGQIRGPGAYCSSCEFPESLLPPGQYFVSIGMKGKPQTGQYFVSLSKEGTASYAVQKEYHDILKFNIAEAGYPFVQKRIGMISPSLSWKIECH